MAAVRWIGSLFKVVYHTRPVDGIFLPNRIDVELVSDSTRLLWCPVGKKPRAKKADAGVGWHDVDDDEAIEDEIERDEEEGETDAEVAEDLDLAEVPGDLPAEGAGDGAKEGDAPALMDLLHDSPVDEGAADPVAVADAIDEVIADAMDGDDMVGDAGDGGGGAADGDIAAGGGVEEVAAVPAAEVPPPAPLVEDEPIPVNVIFAVPGGTITWYAYSDDFVGFCKKGKCRKHRASHGHPWKLGAGRPRGYLMAWLADSAVACPGKWEHGRHWGPPDADQRRAGRAALEAMLGSEALLKRERPRDMAKGEPNEPDVFMD